MTTTKQIVSTDVGVLGGGEDKVTGRRRIVIVPVMFT